MSEHPRAEQGNCDDDFSYWFIVAMAGAFYLGAAIARSEGGLLPSWARYCGAALLLFFGCAGVIVKYRELKKGRA